MTEFSSDSFFFNFTILYCFCHISTWIHHRYTCVPHPEPSSLLPPRTILLGSPSALHLVLCLWVCSTVSWVIVYGNLNRICVLLLCENCIVCQLLGHVWLFVTPWTGTPQAPLSMGFPRQEYWSGLPFPSPEDLPNPEIEPKFPALAGRFFTAEPPGKPIG